MLVVAQQSHSQRCPVLYCAYGYSGQPASESSSEPQMSIGQSRLAGLSSATCAAGAYGSSIFFRVRLGILTIDPSLIPHTISTSYTKYVSTQFFFFQLQSYPTHKSPTLIVSLAFGGTQ
jgi:hypothetical protein